MFTPGQVGDKRYGHAHIDPCPDSDGQHSQEEGPPGGGAGLVEVPPRHSPAGLEEEERRPVAGEWVGLMFCNFFLYPSASNTVEQKVK